MLHVKFAVLICWVDKHFNKREKSRQTGWEVREMKNEMDLFGIESFIGDINYIIRAHHMSPREPHKGYRKWDGKTPYAIHPIWCAMMILTETTLEDTQRQRGATALLYHDLAEDTTVALPNWLSEEVKHLVYEMTFFGGFKEEVREVWNKSEFARLLKLYDKVSNLLDGRDTWMPLKDDPMYRQKYEGHTLRLCSDVEKNFGRLNITLLARTILNHG